MAFPRKTEVYLAIIILFFFKGLEPFFFFLIEVIRDFVVPICFLYVFWFFLSLPFSGFRENSRSPVESSWYLTSVSVTAFLRNVSTYVNSVGRFIDSAPISGEFLTQPVKYF